MMLLVVEGVLEVVGLVTAFKITSCATLVGVVAVAFRLLVAWLA